MKKQIHFPRAGQKLLMLVAILLIGVTSAWADEDPIVTEAKACYTTVTSASAKVDDAAHNANYDNLKAAIDADPQVLADLQKYTEDCYRQYYYDKLASSVLVETNYLKNYVQDDQDKEDLQAALDGAAHVYGDAIDLTKPSSDYKSAYDALEAEVVSIITNEYDDAHQALMDQIVATADAQNDLAYNDLTDPTSYASQLAAYQQAAQKVWNDAEETKAGIQQLRTATTDLAANTKTVVDNDKADAKNALATAINEATTYNTNTVSIESDVVSKALSDAIAAAQTVKDNAATTAKQALAAAETLNTAKATAETNLKAFQDAKKALNAAITAATTDKGAYDAASVGAAAYLQDAIDVAQTVATAAKEKTTAELTTATTTLTAAQAVADKTNTSAIALNGAITNATTAKTAAVDDATKTEIQAAIDAVQPDMADKTKLSADLDADLAQLNSAVSGYVDADIAAQRTALIAAIAKATDARTQTGSKGDYMAYDSYKSQLLACETTATSVKDNTSATAQQLKDATEEINNKYAEIVAADKAAAETALEKAEADAYAAKLEIDKTSTLYGTRLQTAISTSYNKYEADTYSAYKKDAKATELNELVVTYQGYITTLENNIATLKDAITAATTAKDGYAATHTGVKNQLQDAIDAAQAVVDAEKTEKYEVVEKATTTLNTAKANADAANTAATNLETAIATANTTKATIVDATVKSTLESAISTASAYLSDKTATEATLISAKQTLESAITSNVSDDTELARTALSNAITAANTAKGTLGYDANKNTLDADITTATDVKDNTMATATQLDAAKTTLNTAKDNVVAKDLQEATTELATAITDATAKETSIKALSDKIDAKYATEKAAFNDAVLNDLTKAIQAAQLVQDADPASTGAAKVEQVAKLANAVTAADAALALYYNTELQKLADEYTADKDLSAQVKAEATALNDLNNFDNQFEEAEKVYVSVKGGEDTYDAGDIIAARLALVDAKEALKNAKTAWDAAVAALTAKIAEATTESGKIQTPAHDAIKATLDAAIAAAQDVLDAKKTTATDALNTATETLDAAIKAAQDDDENWYITDSNADPKVGTYAEKHIKYTRTGSAIAEGNYATFCLPFDFTVPATGLAKVYTPAGFSIYDENAKTLKLFLVSIDGGANIPAGTPFLAEIGTVENSTLNLYNNAETVVTGPVTAGTQNVTVFNQTNGSSFVSFNSDMTFTWTGSLARTTTGIENAYVFGKSGSFAHAGSAIPAFRAYFIMNTVSPVKGNINIEFEFDDDNTATAIQNIKSSVSSKNGNIYTVDGKNVGNNSDKLSKGIYIINGKKVIK